MLITKMIGEVLLFLVGLPLMAYQSIEMLNALIEFVSDMAQLYQSK